MSRIGALLWLKELVEKFSVGQPWEAVLSLYRDLDFHDVRPKQYLVQWQILECAVHAMMAFDSAFHQQFFVAYGTGGMGLKVPMFNHNSRAKERYGMDNVNDFCLKNPVFSGERRTNLLADIDAHLAELKEDVVFVVGSFTIVGKIRVRPQNGELIAIVLADSDDNVMVYSGTITSDFRALDGELEVFGRVFSVTRGIPQISLVSAIVADIPFENARLVRCDDVRNYEKKTIAENVENIEMIESIIYPRELRPEERDVLMSLESCSADELVSRLTHVELDEPLDGDFQGILSSSEHKFIGSFLNGNVPHKGVVFDKLGNVVAKIAA